MIILDKIGDFMLDRDIYYGDLKTIDKKEYIEPIDAKDPYKEIDEICAKLNIIKNAMLRETSLAEMGCVVESSEERPIIGTQALDTCYGILFYDRLNKKGLVGHGAPSTKVATLHEMMTRINDGTEKVVEYMIVPGFRNVDYRDMSGVDELLMELEKYCPSNVKFVPLLSGMESQVKLHKPTLSYEFAFDTRNGRFVSENIFFEETEVNPRYISKSHSGLGM